LGIVFSGAPVIIPAIANWFANRRGTAIGIGIAGGALSFSMVTYAEYLISMFGWRLSFVLLSGTVVGIAIPLVLLFFSYRPRGQEQHPQEMETVPASENEYEKKEVNVSSASNNLSAVQIIKNHRLWLLMLAYMLYMGIANYMIIAHQVVFFLDLGYGSLFAASVAGAVGIFAALGALSGFLSDWMGREKIFTLASVLSIISLLILLSQKDASSPWALYIFVFCFGFPMGLHVPTMVAGAADLFYGKHFGMVNGMLLMGFGLGGAIGPWIGGYIFDVTGNYSLAFIIGIAAYGLACISFWIAAPRRAARTA
ncbi:MAG: MFS transporter, partial [Dehalococcoidales bacterium]